MTCAFALLFHKGPRSRHVSQLLSVPLLDDLKVSPFVPRKPVQERHLFPTNEPQNGTRPLKDVAEERIGNAGMRHVSQLATFRVCGTSGEVIAEDGS